MLTWVFLLEKQSRVAEVLIKGKENLERILQETDDIICDLGNNHRTGSIVCHINPPKPFFFFFKEIVVSHYLE